MYSHEFDVIGQALPMPPVAITTDFALKTTKRPCSRQYPIAPTQRLAIGEQPHDRALHVHVEAHVHAAVLQRANHLQAGAIADVAQPLVGVPAERALQNVSVRGAIENRAPLLEFPHALRRFLRVKLRHAPVVQHLPAAHGVAEVRAPAVRGVHVGHGRGDAALGHHRVRFAQQRLAHHAHRHALRQSLNRRPQTRAARANHQHIMFVCFESIAQKILTS